MQSARHGRRLGAGRIRAARAASLYGVPMSMPVRFRAVVRVAAALALAASSLLLPTAAAEAVTTPPVLVGLDGPTGRIALFSSSTGKIVKYLTAASRWEEGLPTYTWGRTSVLFIRNSNGTTPFFWGTFLVPATGGASGPIRTAPYGGAQPIASGPKGAFAGNYGSVATRAIHATNTARHTVDIVGTRATPDDALAWSPDGVHLAVGTIKTTTANAGSTSSTPAPRDRRSGSGRCSPARPP